MDQAESFRRIAAVLRSAQRAAIEVENAPDKRKRLRSFSTQEVASLPGVKPRELRPALAAALGRRPAFLRSRLSFNDFHAVRRAMCEQSRDTRYLPRRDPAAQEALAVVAFANFKGGSAKTTSSVHFAQYMALAGYRVLLVDLDSQGSATAQFGIDPATEVRLENSFAAWTTAREDGAAIGPATLCGATYWPSIDI